MKCLKTGDFGLSQIQLESMREINRWISFFLLIAVALSQSSCSVWHTMPYTHYYTQEAPESLITYYSYPKETLMAAVIKEEDERKYVFRQVEIPLILTPDMELKPKAEWQKEVIDIKSHNEKEAKDLSLHYTNRLDLYLPKAPGKRPVILISPILGGNMVVDIFAKYFAKRGFVAVIVHRKRTFWDETRDMEQLELYLRTSVIRIRQAIDWIETQDFADAQKIGGFGISYGAILHSVLAAIEPRIRYHILAMPGGPLKDIIMDCPDPNIKKLRKRIYKLGWSKEKLHSELEKHIKTDPIKVAPYIQKDRVLIMGSVFDRVVGFSRTIRLWHHMNRPELKLIPLGHYGGVLIFPYLEWVALHRFRVNLN